MVRFTHALKLQGAMLAWYGNPSDRLPFNFPGAFLMLDAVLNFLSNGVTHASWLAMLVYLLVVTQLTIFSVTLYLHRSQAHRGVDFHPVIAHVFRFWTLADHRHGHQGVGRDPSQAPRQVRDRGRSAQPADLRHQQGVLATASSCTAKPRGERERHGEVRPRHARTTGSSATSTRAHPYWGPTLLLFISFALFGVVGVAVWAMQMLWIPFWAAGVVNGLGHWWGYRNFETADTATNLTPWGVWIGGEELHNNHHAFPSSAQVRAAQVGVRHRLGG